jgi:hypothetical protein
MLPERGHAKSASFEECINILFKVGLQVDNELLKRIIPYDLYYMKLYAFLKNKQENQCRFCFSKENLKKCKYFLYFFRWKV